MRKNALLRFPISEYERRLSQVRDCLRARQLDALFTRNPDHICYLTGYEDPHIVMFHGLLVTPDDCVLFLRRYELANVQEYTWLTKWVTVEDEEHPSDVVAKNLCTLGLRSARIGLEWGLRKSGMFLGVEEYDRLRAALEDVTFVGASDLIASVRVIKDVLEIEAMRQAARVAESAVKAAIGVLRPGCSENEVAAEYYRAAISSGGEYTSLTSFFTSGPRTALPHGTWRERRVELGDPFFFEVSANRYRYEVPVMRTVSVGTPSSQLSRMAAATLAALNVGLETIRPGITGEAAHQAIYTVMERNGLAGEYYKHPSGYSIGLSLPPSWSETHYLTLNFGEKKVLRPNMTFHVVPLALIYGELGVGFSAAIRVTEDGCEALTESRYLEVI